MQNHIRTSAGSCLALRLQASGPSPLSVTYPPDPVADGRAWREGRVVHKGYTWVQCDLTPKGLQL